MADLFLLSRVQMRRIERYFPRSYGIARVDDRRIVSAIVFVIKNGLRWRDAPRDWARTRQSTIGSFAQAACASSAELTSHRRILPVRIAEPQALGNVGRRRTVPRAAKPCQFAAVLNIAPSWAPVSSQG